MIGSEFVFTEVLRLLDFSWCLGDYCNRGMSWIFVISGILFILPVSWSSCEIYVRRCVQKEMLQGDADYVCKRYEEYIHELLCRSRVW